MGFSHQSYRMDQKTKKVSTKVKNKKYYFKLFETLKNHLGVKNLKFSVCKK